MDSSSVLKSEEINACTDSLVQFICSKKHINGSNVEIYNAWAKETHMIVKYPETVIRLLSILKNKTSIFQQKDILQSISKNA